LFASSSEEPHPRRGFSIWLAAALALVFGIIIGFASGYRAGKGASTVEVSGAPNPAPTSGAGGRTFSESSVSEPVNLNAAPIEGEPDKPAGQRQPANAPAAVEPVPPRTQAIAPSTTLRAPRAATRSAANPPGPTTPSATGPGSLQVVSRPDGAQVVLDGRAAGKTPLTILDVAPGAHSIRLELPGFKRWATTVDVNAGDAKRVAASLEQ